MASVALAGVSKVFPGGLCAVNSLDVEVQDGEFLVLLGPSGCGKSTTLRLIAGLERATAGEIRIGGEVVNDVAPFRRNIAMVFQSYALYPHLSVYRNMAYSLELCDGGSSLQRIWRRLTSPAGAALAAAKRRESREQVRQTALALGIEHLLDRMPRQLSGGERQRVALGRAIVRQPAVFLFDEPLSNLDARLRWELRRELKELHQRIHATMIYVTHDQSEAMALGDRILLMERGQKRQLGTPSELYGRPRDRFVAGFVGAAPMNFVEGKVDMSDGATFVRAGFRMAMPENLARELAQRSASRELVLGVRPEDVEVLSAAEAPTDNAGQITSVEPLGDHALVHVAIAGNGSETNNNPMVITSKAASSKSFRPGDTVSVRFFAGRLHWFDARSGLNLLPDRWHEVEQGRAAGQDRNKDERGPS